MREQEIRRQLLLAYDAASEMGATKSSKRWLGFHVERTGPSVRLPDREPSLHPLPGRSAAGLLPCPGAWVPQGLLPRLVPQPGEQARDSFRLCEPPGHRAAARAAVWAYAVGARGPGGSSPHPARPFPATPSARPPRSPPQGGLGIPGVAAKPQFLPLAARCEDARRRATNSPCPHPHLRPGGTRAEPRSSSPQQPRAPAQPHAAPSGRREQPSGQKATGWAEGFRRPGPLLRPGLRPTAHWLPAD